MCDMAGLPCIPQLHGMLFATRIPIVLRSGASDSPQPELLAHGVPQNAHWFSTDDVKACSSMIFR